MNKFTRKMMLAIACIIAGCINVQAQYQLPNPGFEGTWKDVSGKGGIMGSTTVTGQEPEGFHSFITAKVGSGFGLSAAVAKQLESSTVVRPGSTGKTSAKIWSGNPIGSIIANGNLTTGRINAGSMTATDTSGNYNYTDPAESGYNQPFIGKPDTITTWVKYEPANVPASKGSNLARVSAIIHENSRYQDPEAQTYTNVVAKAQLNYAPASDNGWQRLSIPFVYEKSTNPSYLLLTFSTNQTPAEGSINDVVYVDDIEFIYNSKLESLKIGGVAVEGFDKDTYTYTITSDGTVPSEDQIEAISDGKGATITKSTNGNAVTITVSGNDISINPENKHIYTLTFAKDLQVEKLAGIYNGSIDIDLSVMGAEPPVLTVPDQITIEKSEINELQLTLKNFSFIGLTLGDIVVDKISVTENGSNYNINSKEPVALSLMGGAIQASVSVSGTIQADGTTSATIDVDATGLGKIPVTFKGKKVEEGLRLNELVISGEANTITFDPDVFNYKSLDIVSTDILTYTADPSLKVNISIDGNWIYLNVTDGDKVNIYKLANADISKPIKAITINQAIDGNLELSDSSEINGDATVSGTISYVKQIDGNAWNVIGLPFIPTVNVVTNNTTAPAEADWYTYTNENGEYKPQSLSAVNNACIMKLKTYNEATALELISIAGSSIKGGELTITEGYNICPNNTLATQKLTDLITADTYYLFDQTAQVFNIVSDPSTATVAPSEMFIALKGNNPVATIVTPDVYEQGIENNGTIENMKVYSTNGNVFVQGYTGIVEIYLLNGGKVAQKEVSGNSMFRLEPNTYIIRTGTKATMVIVK